MPLKWEEGRNPYVFNSFAKLEAGPAIQRNQVVTKARHLKIKVEGGQDVRINGSLLSAPEIEEAKNTLTTVGSLAEELLLVHQVPPQEDSEVEQASTELLKLLENPVSAAGGLPLAHPMCLAAFIPPPARTAAPMPDPEALGLVSTAGSTHPPDDVIFDY